MTKPDPGQPEKIQADPIAEIGGWTVLRGMAALWIVLFHFWPQTDLAQTVFVARGYLAVDLFFVLSGVVMMHCYGRSVSEGRFRARKFLFRRFARLYPVHFVTLIVACVVLVFGPVLGMGGRELPYDPLAMAALQLFLLHAWGLTETGGLNYPSWSIAAEAFAYILFPVLAVLVLRLPPRAALGAGIFALLGGVFLAQRLWPSSLGMPETGLVFTRMENDFGALRILPEFALGLAIGRQTGSHSPRAVAICCTALLAMGLSVWFQADLAFIFAGATLILGLGRLGSVSFPPLLLWLGRVSYSLYMVHALVQIVGFKLIERLMGFGDGQTPGYWLVPMVLLALASAECLRRWVEVPARQWLLDRRPREPGVSPLRPANRMI